MCGCSLNKTDDVKIEIESSKDEEGADSTAAEPATGQKNEMTKKFCTDLNNTDSVELIENMAKLIAELSKEGIRINY